MSPETKQDIAAYACTAFWLVLPLVFAIPGPGPYLARLVVSAALFYPALALTLVIQERGLRRASRLIGQTVKHNDELITRLTQLRDRLADQERHRVINITNKTSA